MRGLVAPNKRRIPYKANETLRCSACLHFQPSAETDPKPSWGYCVWLGEGVHARMACADFDVPG